MIPSASSPCSTSVRSRFLKQHRKATTFPIRVSSGTWINHRTFRAGTAKAQIRKARIFLTIKGAQEQFPELPRACVHRWSTRNWPCRFLSDSAGGMRPIECLLVDSPLPRNRKQVTVLSKDDLQKIDAGYASTNRATETEYTDREGTWATARRLCELRDVDQQFAWYWSKKQSLKHPKAFALRSRSEPLAMKGKTGPRVVMRFCVQDADRILSGEETKHNGEGHRLRICRRSSSSRRRGWA
jgi:hypothetical protein